MYHNYGSYDFFRNGVLAKEIGKGDGRVHARKYDMVLCLPNDDNTFRCARITASWDLDWIDLILLEERLGYNPDFMIFTNDLEITMTCIDIYPWDKFDINNATSYDWKCMTKEQVEEELSHYLIAWNELTTKIPNPMQFDIKTMKPETSEFETSNVGARRMSNYEFMRFTGDCMNRFKNRDWGDADEDQLKSNNEDPMNALGIYCFNGDKTDQLWIKAEDKGYGQCEITAMFPLEY